MYNDGKRFKKLQDDKVFFLFVLNELLLKRYKDIINTTVGKVEIGERHKPVGERLKKVVEGTEILKYRLISVKSSPTFLMHLMISSKFTS